jgi:HSP20 family protein
MTDMIRWDPFGELRSWNDRLSRVIGAGGDLSRARGDEPLQTGTWIPPVDIVEGKDRITLKAELPGFKENQVDLTVEDGVLTIRGERKFEKETGDENFHRVERSYGNFVRSFSLPTNVDQGKITAQFSDGILHVEMPKREETKPKQIKITPGATGSSAGSKDVDVKKAK